MRRVPLQRKRGGGQKFVAAATPPYHVNVYGADFVPSPPPVHTPKIKHQFAFLYVHHHR